MRLARPPSGRTDQRPARKRLKTMRSLSGDQARRLTGTPPDVTWIGSPSARFLTHTCATPSTSLRNAMKLPSGEKLAPQCSPENVEINRRLVACRGSAGRPHSQSPAATAAATDTHNAATIKRRLRRFGETGAVAPTRLEATCELSWLIHFKASARSRADCHRSSGSFVRHFLTTRSRAGAESAARGNRRRLGAQDRGDERRLAGRFEGLAAGRHLVHERAQSKQV